MKASQAKAFAFGRTDEFDAEKVGYDRQKKLLERIRFQVLDDLGDTWAHGVKELGPTLGDARLVDVKELDNGPVVSLIHAFYEWKNSKFELKLYAWKDIEEIEAELQQGCGDEWLTDDQAYLTSLINRYLSRISEKRRAVLVLRFWHIMSLSEISQRTGLNINTVKTILSREMQSMKQFLIKEGAYRDE